MINPALGSWGFDPKHIPQEFGLDSDGTDKAHVIYETLRIGNTRENRNIAYYKAILKAVEVALDYGSTLAEREKE